MLQSINDEPSLEGGWKHRLTVSLLASAVIATILWVAFLCTVLISFL
jgi:hypothetical protein